MSIIIINEHYHDHDHHHHDQPFYVSMYLSITPHPYLLPLSLVARLVDKTGSLGGSNNNTTHAAAVTCIASHVDELNEINYIVTGGEDNVVKVLAYPTLLPYYTTLPYTSTHKPRFLHHSIVV